jgi:hypothetical protein
MAEQQQLINDKKDWSALSSDLVCLIAKKLPHLLDFIRVRVTCKSWRSSTSPSDFPLCFPWLLEFDQTPMIRNISLPTTRLHLYSMSSSEILTIPIKETTWLRGSSNNYLPLIDDRSGTISLFNPLTNDEFVLPVIHDLVSYLVIWTEPGPVHDRRILVVDYGDYRDTFMDHWFIYDPHLEKWNVQKGFCRHSCYCQGMFFANSFENKVYDVSSKELLYEILPHEDEITNAQHGEQIIYINLFESYIVDSSGVILKVLWYYPERFLRNKSKFQIYRLNMKGVGGKPCWDKISDLGDQILFLEVIDGNFMTVNYFSMTAAPAVGLRRGHIYFIDPFNGKPYAYDFASSTVEMIFCPFEKCTWFVLGYAS